ncbi:MAG TPA: hypothetical protein VGI44_12570 [Acidimicrobiales bacterium]
MSSVDTKERSGGELDAAGAQAAGAAADDVRLGALFDRASASLHQAVDALEPECLSGADAKDLYASVVEVLRLATAAKIALATRIESSGIWKRSGHKNAATLIAETEGVGVGHARSTLETGRALVDAPKTAEALRDGKLSEPQVKELAGAVAVDPGREAELVDAAEGGEPMPALKDRCRRTRARAAGADPDRTLAAIHADRHLRQWIDEEGAFCLHGRFTPDRGAQLASVLDKATTDCFDRARQRGEREPRAAYGADALVELLCGDSPHKGRPRTVVNIRVDHEALVNGRASGNQVAAIDGIGEVPVSTIESLLPDSFLKVLFYDADELTRISHPGRTLPEKLKTALDNEYPTCVVPSCGATRFLEADHIQTVLDHGPTQFNNLVHLCHFHLGLKTNAGYVVYRDTLGTWHFDPPPPFRDEPDLGGEAGGGLHDHIGDGGHPPSQNETDPTTGRGSGADQPGPTSTRRTGRPKKQGSRRRSTSRDDAAPGESPPLFELGE